MNKRIFAVVLAVLLVAMSGCQLAVEDNGESAASTQDRLVGVLVTRENLDLFDMEAYLNDNLDQVVDGGEITAENTAQYSGRLYATLTEETLTGEDGKETINRTYEFEGVDGYFLACYLVDSKIDPAITEEDRYWNTVVNSPFSDVHTGMHVVDGDEMIKLEAAIYTAQKTGAILFFLNPVYQSDDGRLYAVEGQGGRFQAGNGNMIHTLKDERTTTEDGEEKTSGAEIMINVACVTPAQKIQILHMNEDNQVLQTQEYEKEEIPAFVDPVEGAAYVICEEYDETGEVTRQISDPQSEPIEIFQKVDGEICVKRQLTVNWPEE